MARTIRIGFLGNGYIFGYPGVAARDTNAMVKRVTATHDVTMIDRQQIIEGADHALFLGTAFGCPQLAT
jgi:hypothetical protein